MGRSGTYVFAILLVLSSVATQASGQAGPIAPSLQPTLQNPYVLRFQDVLLRWDKKDLTFHGKDTLAKTFYARLDDRVNTKPLGYETLSWKDAESQRWSQLPPSLTPSLPLSSGAKLALIAGYVDNMPSFKFEPTYTNVFETSEAGLFAVLSRAQQIARERNRQIISAGEIQESLSSFRTSVFPVCSVPGYSPRETRP